MENSGLPQQAPPPDKEVIAEEIERRKAERSKIDKRLAAMEVARWVDKTYYTAIIGIVLILLMFGASAYASEGFDFLVAAGGTGYFAWVVATSKKFRNYLRAKYDI